MNNKVSVIIPVYNTAIYLTQCLNSVCNQTYPYLEIICINDGSTDDSPQILSKYAAKDDRIKIITQENKGLSDTRNAGIEAATGDWISFIDSDDFIDLNFYETLIKDAIKNNSDITMCMTKRFENNYGDKNIFPPYLSFSTNKLEEKIALLRGGGCCDKVYKSNLIKDNNLCFSSGHNYEGNLFLLQCVYFCKIFSTVLDTFYHYRVNDFGICKSLNIEAVLKREKDRIFALDKMVEFAKKANFNRAAFSEMKKLIRHSVLDNKQTRRKYFIHLIHKLGLIFLLEWLLKNLCFKILKKYDRKYYTGK